MEPMKRFNDLAKEIANSQDLRGLTSPIEPTGTPVSYTAPQPLTIICFDPEKPDAPCPICAGLGVIKYGVQPDDPRFGKLYRCPNHPAEEDVNRQQRLRRLSNLNAFMHKSFENFDPNIPGYSDKERESLQLAYQAAMSYAEKPDGWLLLEGRYGTGKTHLAAAVGNARLEMGEIVLFLTTPDLLDHLRGTYAPGSDVTYDETFERILTAELLILDDLGVENPSEWAKEKLFQLLNTRYTHRRSTVITTNVDLDTLDPRIRSRLMDIDIIKRQIINAPDYRNNTPNQQGQLLSRLKMYDRMTFETFDIERHVTREEHERLTMAAENSFRYAQNPDGWLLFTGSFGSGKTHLAAAIANLRRKEFGEEVVFLTVPDLLDYLRTTFAPDSPVTFDKLLDNVRNVRLLILDDLGMESAKPWAQEKLFQILDYRYVANLPTVITMTKQMKDINDRIVSRLIDPRICRIIEINIPSYARRLKRS